jgi:hypothetical protein
MKVNEIIQLAEMASDRAQVRQKIGHLSPKLLQHLVLLYAFNSPENVHHWKSEVNAFLRKIATFKLTSSNKNPSASDVYQWIVDADRVNYTAEGIQRVIRMLKNKDYATVRLHDYDIDTITNEMLILLKAIAKDISAGREPDINEYF